MYPRGQLRNNRYRKAQNAPAVMVASAASNRSALHFRVGAPGLGSITYLTAIKSSRFREVRAQSGLERDLRNP